MAKYGKAASRTVESAVRRHKKGTLKSGSGRKVTSRKQAIAIALSEARQKGAKVPPAPRRRKVARKSGATKGTSKGPRKTSAAQRSAPAGKTRASSARKTASGKTAPRKSGARKTSKDSPTR